MKNFSKTRFAGYGLLVTLLSGCVTLPKTDLNSENRQKLHSIAILGINEPKGVAVVNIGGAGAAFGLVGALVQSGINSDHTSAYTKQVADQKIVFAPILADSVIDHLSESGYQLVKLDGQKVTLASDGKSDDYSSIHTDADAILNVWIASFGYISPPETPNFIPWVVVRARMLDAKTKQDIYFKTFACGYDIKGNSVHIESDAAFSYGSFDGLEKSFDKSVEGIKACEKSIASAIGQDLARVPPPVAKTATMSSGGETK